MDTYMDNSIHQASKFLSERTLNAIIKSGVLTIRDLVNLVNGEFNVHIYDMPRLGRKGIEEIKFAYNNLNIKKTNNLIKREELDKQIIADKDLSWITYKGDTINIFFSIRYFDLPNREINSLEKNGINTIYDILTIDEHIARKTKDKMEGVGRKTIKSIKTIANEIFNEHNYELRNFIHAINISDIVEVEKITINILIESYLKNLSQIKKGILKTNTFLLLKSVEKLLFADIARKNGVTGELIRQESATVIEDMNNYCRAIRKSIIGKKLINYLIEHYCMNDFGSINIKNDFPNIINRELYMLFINNILGEKIHIFGFEYNGEFPHSLIYLKSDIITFKTISPIIKRINKIGTSKRMKQKIINLDTFLGKSESGIYYFIKKFILYYYKTVYGCIINDNNIMFRINKRNFPIMILEELKNHKSGIHYTELYNILREKHSQFKWNEGTILSVLIASEKATNIGPGFYSHKVNKPKEGFIGDIVEKLLLTKVEEKATFKEIEEYVLKHKRVKKGSIKVMLFDQDKKDRFIKLPNNKVGLSYIKYK